MTGKTMRRIWWFDPWQIEEAGAWLSQLAERGWHLHRVGWIWLVFKQGEPHRFRYRCEVFRRKRDHDDFITVYREAGWEFVGTYGFFHIFRAPQDALISEIHTDSAEQAYTLLPLRSNYLRLILVATLFLALAQAPYFIGSRNFLVNLVLYAGLGYILSIAFMLGFIVWSLIGLARVNKIIGQLQSGAPFTHTRVNTGTFLLKPCLIVLILVFFVVSGVFIGRQVRSQNHFLPLPQGWLPVVRIAELANDANVEGLPANTFITSSSMLVPRQWFVREVAEVSRDESYTSVMLTFFYEAKSQWLAKKLGKALTTSPPVQLDNYESKLILVESPFDALWIHHGRDVHELIAVQGKYVYLLYYDGLESMEDLLELIKEKLDSLDGQLPLGSQTIL